MKGVVDVLVPLLLVPFERNLMPGARPFGSKSIGMSFADSGGERRENGTGPCPSAAKMPLMSSLRLYAPHTKAALSIGASYRPFRDFPLGLLRRLLSGTWRE